MKAGHEEKTLVQRTRARASSPRTGPAYLTVLTGESVGAVFELKLGESVIGRAAEVTVVLTDDGISRHHAKIFRDQDGSAKLVDLESTNGTFINGRRIYAEGLREGDRIRVGQSATLDFRYEYRESSVMDMRAGKSESDAPALAVRRAGSDQLRGGYENLAATLDSLGKVYTSQGQYDAAIKAYRRTLEIREMKFGRDHPAVAAILDSLGVALQDADEYIAALECHNRALEIYKGQGPQPPRETGHVLANIGKCQLELSQGEAALEALEHAHALLRGRGASTAELSRVRFTMAQALHQLGRDRERTLDLARLSRDAFAAGGKATKELYKEVSRWLEAIEAG